MKMITAIIKPFKLDEVREALTELGVEGLTVTETKGFGRQRGQTENHNIVGYSVAFLPKIKIEIAVSNDMADKVVNVIAEHASTGRIGDGKIFTYELSSAQRIRTGESGDDAL
jgi:nitrogen regulatory protein PII